MQFTSLPAKYLNPLPLSDQLVTVINAIPRSGVPKSNLRFIFEEHISIIHGFKGRK